MKTFLLDDPLKGSKAELIVKVIVYVIAFLISVAYLFDIGSGFRIWHPTEWLINYQGGFIANGLIGHIFYSSPLRGNVLLIFLYFLHASIFFTIVYYLLDLFFSQKRDVRDLMMLISPAFILIFPLYEIRVGFGKEMIVFLSFLLLLKGMREKSGVHIMISTLVYAVSVFSSDVVALGSLFFAYAVIRNMRNQSSTPNSQYALLLLFLIGAVVNISLSSFLPGGHQVVRALRTSFSEYGIDGNYVIRLVLLMNGDPEAGIPRLINCGYRYAVMHIPAIALAFLPVFLNKISKDYFILLVISAIFLIPPIFINSIFWGWWIYVYVFFAYTALLSENKNDGTLGFNTVPPFILALFYPFVWSMPFICSDVVEFELVNRVIQLIVN